MGQRRRVHSWTNASSRPTHPASHAAALEVTSMRVTAVTAASARLGAKVREDAIRFHALRTRRAGRLSFLSVHVLVPGAWSVQRGHDLLEQLEAELRAAVPQLVVFTHLEPLEDPSSFSDTVLDRSASS